LLGHRGRPSVTTSNPAGGRELVRVDLCVIGGGPGGLSVAAAAAALGAKVVLVESQKMGGDSLNYGSVPSKALIAAARRAHVFRTAGEFGLRGAEPEVDPITLRAHVHSVIAAIAPAYSVERFTGLGVHVIQAFARFLDKRTVVAGDYRIRARRFVIATGSSPCVPPISGLDQVPYFTTETVFESAIVPQHLIVIGGGPAGLEFAQAYRRLGSRVTVLEAAKALAGSDPELGAVVLAALQREGVAIRERAPVERVEGKAGRVTAMVGTAPVVETIEGSHLLVATGRRANIAELNLEAARVRYDRHGIKVNAALVTSNRRIYAIGDCTGAPQFAHLATYHSSLVVRRALFRLPVKVKPALVPRVIFTDPELACVGLNEEEARRKARGTIRVLRWPYRENDRAQAERATEGFVKVITDKKGRILGAGVAGHAAGELIQVWSLAVSQGMNIRAYVDWISPYPSFSEINKRAAFRYYATAATKPLLRTAIGLLAKLG
jgi:pyruvate/2-oxoglutarate dehydrogenase complex dihydrolipoamide dehydrogenase (E3) component